MYATKDTFKHSKGSFERLNSTNYHSWRVSMRYLLTALDLWDLVTGAD